MQDSAAARWKIAASMIIFGTIGLFVRYVDLPSSLIALIRGVIGSLFLLALLAVKKQKIHGPAVRRNLLLLVLSGGALGFNWILLFESYRYTTVAVSTLCYYMAPILVIVGGHFILQEALTPKKGLCVTGALLGMACISGVFRGEMPGTGQLRGILLGLAAAVLYAAIVMINKQIRGMSAYDKTIVQLGISSAVMLPYCLLTESAGICVPDGRTLILLLVLGVVHTGLAYYLYFDAVSHVTGQSAAMISYLDPAAAVLLSAAVLREPLDLLTAAGAVLILGAALISELERPGRRKP